MGGGIIALAFLSCSSFCFGDTGGASEYLFTALFIFLFDLLF